MLLFALMAWLHSAVDCNAEEMYTLPSCSHTLAQASEQQKNRIENGNLPTTRNSPVVVDAVYLNVFPVRTYFSHTPVVAARIKRNIISFPLSLALLFSLSRLLIFYSHTLGECTRTQSHTLPNNCTHTGTHKMVLLDSYCLVCSTRLLHTFVRNM